MAEKLQSIYGEDKIVLRPRAAKLGLGKKTIYILYLSLKEFIDIVRRNPYHIKTTPVRKTGLKL